MWRTDDSTCFDAFASSEFWRISLNIPMLNGYRFKTVRIASMRASLSSVNCCSVSMVDDEERRLLTKAQGRPAAKHSPGRRSRQTIPDCFRPPRVWGSPIGSFEQQLASPVLRTKPSHAANHRLLSRRILLPAPFAFVSPWIRGLSRVSAAATALRSQPSYEQDQLGLVHC